MDITPVNDAPTTTPVALTPVVEDSGVRVITQAELLANAGDIEGDSLTANSLSITAGSGTLVDNGDGTFSFTPDANDDTDVSFGYTITDSSDNVTGTATLDITPVNDAPTTTPVVLTPVAEDSGARVITQAELLANAGDIDSNSLTANGLSITAGSGTLVDNGDGTWSYTPAANGDTNVSFSYNVSDGTDTTTGTATLDITPFNEAPTTTPVVLTSIVEDSGVRVITQAELLANAGDVEGDSLTANSLSITAGSGTLVDNGDGTFSYTPDANDDTNVSFSYNVSDGTNNVAGTATLDITPVNDAPTAINDNFTTNEDTSLVISGFTANDVDSDNNSSELTATTFVDPANGTVELNPDGTFTYTPDADFNGVDSFIYLVTDPSGATSTALIQIDVSPVNDVSVALDDTFRINEGGSNVFNVAANDFDIDSNFTFNIVEGPTNGTATIDANGLLNFTHNGEEVFTDSIVYQIIDEDGGFDTATVTIDVQPIDDATNLVNDDLREVTFGEQLIIDPSVILANDMDADNNLSLDNVVVEIVSQPDLGEVVIDINGQLVFTPFEGVSGDTEFEYQIIVNGVESETARVLVSVTPPTVLDGVVNLPVETAVDNNQEQEQQEEQEEQEEQQEQEEQEEEAAQQGRIVNNENEDDEQINPTAARSGPNDILGNFGLESINSLENSTNETVFQSQYAGATYSYASRLDDLSLLNLTGTTVAAAEKVSEFEATYLAGLVWDDLDSAKQSYLLNGVQIGVPTIVSSAASFLTVGYLAWIIRGGVLLTTFMSSVPTWSSFDILSVLDSDNGDESIEQMVDR